MAERKRRRIDYNKVVDMYQMGYTMEEISRMFDTVNGNVSKIIRLMEPVTKVHPRPRGHTIKKRPVEWVIKEQIDRGEFYDYLLKKGNKREDVLELFNVTPEVFAEDIKAYKDYVLREA